MNAQELRPAAPERPRILAAFVGSFLGMVTADFLLHAVLLGQWWRSTESFWRPPNELFALIPYAYASFALYAAGLLWLLLSLRGRRPPLTTAVLFGLGAGAFIGASSVLAIYSAVSLPRSALLVFPVSFATVLAAGATAAALVLSAARPWRRVGLLTVAMILLFMVGVVLQNVFFPTPQSHRVPAQVSQASTLRLPPSCAAA
jgi:hypothetical protein